MPENPRRPAITPDAQALPEAGQSLRSSIFRDAGRVLIVGVIFVGVSAFIAGLFFPWRPPSSPVLTWSVAGGMAGLAVALTLWLNRLETVQQHRLSGMQGERSVAAHLAALDGRTHHVFHDIPIVRGGTVVANIDHAVIGPGGFTAIETKTWSKPAAGKATLQLDRSSGKLLRCGRPLPDSWNDPIQQACSAAQDLAALLNANSTSSTRTPSHAHVTFPGWWVTEATTQRDGIRCTIANPSFLVGLVHKQAAVLAPGDVKAAAAKLEAHIRRHA